MNPSSGTADARRAAEIGEAARSEGLDVLELRSDLEVHSEIRDRIDRGERLFVAAGGDGTINAVLQPLVATEGQLAVLPIGTWNHFARDLRLPLDWRESLRVALDGPVRQIDVGRINDRFFVNNVSLGLYPEVVRHRERFRRYGKWRAYLKATRAALHQFSRLAFTIETAHRLEPVRTHVFMVSVNPYELDLPGVLAPRKTLDGGFLCIYWLPEMPRIELVRTLARYLRGRVTGDGAIRRVQTTHLKIQSSRPTMRVGMDGELRELASPLTLSVQRRALNVRVPRNPVA
ncbi:MAG TPA: diacylglycerol kinase family protein [Thermoanaerobaculia bacterium]|nr:diacylglycerol kinase family protein [Thermoanaerobaculia bacterium]